VRLIYIQYKVKLLQIEFRQHLIITATENQKKEESVDVDMPRLGREHVQLRELATVSDSDLLLGSTALASVALDGLDNVHALGDVTEDHVLAIEPAFFFRILGLEVLSIAK
jgi:hypothetical protein